MAVKGKRADESAPKPSAKKEKKQSNIVEGDFGSSETEAPEAPPASSGKTIGDFAPEDLKDANPGEDTEAPIPPFGDQDDEFTSGAENPNILPGSPFAPKSDQDAINENAADPNIGQLSDEDKAKIIKIPRTPNLPTMESDGDQELEAWATEHEDIQNTIRTMNKRLATLKDFMLGKMQKKKLPRYSHDGFIIEREEKGETVKVKSVKVADED